MSSAPDGGRRQINATRYIIVLAAYCAATVNAQDLVIEEIVVTATKRPESTQDIPIAVSAFTSAQLAEAGVKDIRDIAGQTPGLSIKSRGDTEASVFIRGIGSQAPGIGADPAVGIYIDGLYAARGTNATAAFFDVERVEVVKGPQGTLFGRNASAGAISIITKKPELGEMYGFALVGFGNEGQQKYEFIYNASVSDTFALRFGAKHDRRDGLYKNAATGKELNGRENTNARVSFLFEGGGIWNSFFSYEYIDSTSVAGFVTAADAFANEVRMDDAPANQTLESSRVNWTNDWVFNDGVSLTSITGYYDHDVNVTPVDADLAELFVASFEEPQTAEMFSQELRINGRNDALDWFVGASFVKENLTFINDFNYDEFVVAELFGLNNLDIDGDACNGMIDLGDGNGPFPVPACLASAHETPSGDGETESVAIYADFTWHISDSIDLSAGVRYTNDEKTLTYDNPSTGGLLSAFDPQIFGWITPMAVTDTKSFSSTDPRLAINWHVTDGTMIYASAAQAYKSGGLNRQYDAPAGTIRPFDKEENTAYELGVKTAVWRGRGQINAAIFRNNYDNYQLEELINLVPQIDNIGNVKVAGFEADFRVLLTESFEVSGSLSLLDAELKDAATAANQGNKMPHSPETSGHISGRWSVPARSGDFDLIVTWTYNDSFFFDLANTFEQESYSTIDARISWANDTWGVAFAGENLTGEEILAEQFLFLDVTSIRAPGRLLRFETHLNF